MKRIETRLENLESRVLAMRSAKRGYCECPVETEIKDPVTLDKLPQENNHKKSRITGICPRCGGRFSKDHPELPKIVIYPVIME